MHHPCQDSIREAHACSLACIFVLSARASNDCARPIISLAQSPWRGWACQTCRPNSPSPPNFHGNAASPVRIRIRANMGWEVFKPVSAAVPVPGQVQTGRVTSGSPLVCLPQLREISRSLHRSPRLIDLRVCNLHEMRRETQAPAIV